ncbi:MAG: hypothetical protein CMO01_05235 [Thalassobius sp.]|nr:hypothetical protein [Thalassovita sp.]
MKTLKLFLLISFFPTMLFAQSDIVGDWKLEYTDDQGQTVAVQLTISDDGEYTVDFNMDGKLEVMGKYEYEDGKMTIWDTGGDYSCGPDKKGVYNITASTNELTMSRVSEDCPDRGNPEGFMTFQKISS